jgi:hypothetical protein
VRVALVLLRLIHPVWPFGRPGSRTRSQAAPPTDRWPITGSTVRSPVIGRVPGTSSTAEECVPGADIAVCDPCRIASSCVGAARELPPLAVATASTAARRARADDMVARPARFGTFIVG